MNSLFSRVKSGKLATIAFVFAALAFLLVFYGMAINNTPESNAVSALDFKAGRIIDDEVFYNPDTMTVSEIQAHLDKYSANCDMWGTNKIGYGRYINGKAVDPNITRREYARLMREAGRTDYHDAPYVCISKYYENPTTHKTNFDTNAQPEEGMISAAQIIYNAAHEYSINPQVLLVMLKKESYVWGDMWPLKNEYNTVMGYGCPDNAPCDSAYFGFYNQVMKAAWQLKYYKDHIYSYGYYPYMTNNIYYSPNFSCGTKSVYLENIATTSLYIYTPYTPNDAALANYPGEAYCGSYGNRNFFMYFSEWFGSTLSEPGLVGIANYYSKLGEEKNKLGRKVGSIQHNTHTGIAWQEYEHGFILGSDRTGYYESMGEIRNVWSNLGFENGSMGFPVSRIYSNEQTGLKWQEYEHGFILGSDRTGYYESSGKIREVWAKSGFEMGKLGLPISDITILQTGLKWQEYEHGFILGSDRTGYYESSGKIREVWAKSGFEMGKLGLPISDVSTENGITSQKYERGVVYTSM